jgi:hypothetical protein
VSCSESHDTGIGCVAVAIFDAPGKLFPVSLAASGNAAIVLWGAIHLSKWLRRLARDSFYLWEWKSISVGLSEFLARFTATYGQGEASQDGRRGFSDHTARRKFDTAVLREAITAAVTAHGKGLILSKEMPVPKDTREGYIRYAPSFAANQPAPESGARPYTTQALAQFLGFTKPGKRQEPTDSFVAAFGAEELIADGIMKESQIKGLSAERLGELVISVRKQRDAAKVEAGYRSLGAAFQRASYTGGGSEGGLEPKKTRNGRHWSPTST